MRRIEASSGSLLVVTLWVIMILTVFAVAIARYLTVEIRLTRYRLAREQAAALARSGIYLAMQRLQDDQTPDDWLGDSWALPWGPIEMEQGTIQVVSCVDEERKLNVNALPGEGDVFFRAVGTLLGSEELAAKLVDAVDRESPPTVFQGLGLEGVEPGYLAKNAPLDALEELLEIPGMPELPPETFTAFRARASVHQGTASRLNINTADREVLLALGLHTVIVDAIDQFRQGPDGPERHEQDGVFQGDGAAILEAVRVVLGASIDLNSETYNTDRHLLETLMGTTSKTFSIVSEGMVRRPAVRVRVEAVVRRDDCDPNSPAPCVVAWKQL